MQIVIVGDRLAGIKITGPGQGVYDLSRPDYPRVIVCDNTPRGDLYSNGVDSTKHSQQPGDLLGQTVIALDHGRPHSEPSGYVVDIVADVTPPRSLFLKATAAWITGASEPDDVPFPFIDMHRFAAPAAERSLGGCGLSIAKRELPATHQTSEPLFLGPCPSILVYGL